MPRFRLRDSQPIEYFFAARFRRAPGAWFAWAAHTNDWSVLSDELFQATFAASNEEARKLLRTYSTNPPKEEAAI